MNDYTLPTLPTQDVGSHTGEEEDNETVQTWWGRLVSIKKSQEDEQIFIFANGKNEYIFGRNPRECDVVLDGPDMSNQHYRIFEVSDRDDRATSSTALLEDLSTNGTFLNGIKLGKGNKRVLIHGDEICCSRQNQMFEHRFIFQKPPQLNQSSKDDGDAPFLNAYDVRHELGRGNFSIVRLAIHKQTGVKYAVKIIDKRRFVTNGKVDEALGREVEIMKSIHHPNIVHLHEAFETQNTTYLVMELISGGDVFQYVHLRGALPETEARALFIQMIKAVKYLHGAGIVHRDLKPDNYLVTPDKTVKLADFGLAKAIGADKLQTVCGTPVYLAPEVQDGGHYDSRVDLYSLGAILFFLLSGKTPFDETAGAAIFELISQGRTDWSDLVWKSMSTSATSLIKRLMEVDPRRRITLSELENHPWLHNLPLPTSSTAVTPDKFRKPEDRNVWATLRSQEPSEVHHKIFKSSFSIGRRTGNDLILNDPRVSGLHCKITRTDGIATLHDFSANGVRVNGVMSGKSSPVELKSGDVLILVPQTLKEAAIIYTFVEETPASMKRSASDEGTAAKRQRLESDSPLILESLDTASLPQFIPIKPDMTFGRRPDCDVMLTESAVSSLHCRLITRNGATELEDCSSNGTWVNGVKVGKGKRVVLKEGDEILLLNRRLSDRTLGFRCKKSSIDEDGSQTKIEKGE